MSYCDLPGAIRTGGTLDGAVIGGVTPAAITCTILTMDTANYSNAGIVAASPGSSAGLYASLSNVAYNGIVVAGDSALLFTAGTAGTGHLVIAPINAGSAGLRMDGAGNIVQTGTLTVSGLITASNALTANGLLTANGGVKVAAGTATLAPVTLTAGVNLTTAAAGAYEFDGTAFYLTAAANTRQVVVAEQWAVLSAAYTLTSQTAAQKLFNDSANGAFTLPVGTYEFECAFSLTGMSTGTACTFGFAFGGTAVMTQAWWAEARMATGSSATAPYQTFNTAANGSIALTSTTGAGTAMIKGILRVTTAGTVIPEVSLSVAAAAIVGANSYFRIGALGSATFTRIGNRS